MTKYTKEQLLKPISANEREETDWLLYPFIPFGCLTTIQGDPGCGKSILMLNIAAQLTKGRTLDGEAIEPAPVIYQSREDSYTKNIRPRLEDMGVDIDNMAYSILDEDGSLTVHDERIGCAIEAAGAKLVVIDTLTKFLDTEEDINHRSKVQPQLEALDKAAKDFNCAIVMISHLNKNESGKPIYRGEGSIALAGFVRSNVLLEREGKTSIRTLSIVKSNAAPDDIENTYTLDSNGVYHFVERTRENQEEDHVEEPVPDLSPAAEELMRILSDGPVPSNEAHNRMKTQGFKDRQFNAAKKELGLKPVKGPNGWYMDLSERSA